MRLKSRLLLFSFFAGKKFINFFHFFVARRKKKKKEKEEHWSSHHPRGEKEKVLHKHNINTNNDVNDKQQFSSAEEHRERNDDGENRRTFREEAV